jgi:hypothetical protein
MSSQRRKKWVFGRIKQHPSSQQSGQHTVTEYPNNETVTPTPLTLQRFIEVISNGG